MTSASLASVDTLARSRNLTTMLRAHQILATLSSKRPRAKGNMRWIDWRSVEGDRRKGEKTTAKVDNVTMPMLIKREKLGRSDRQQSTRSTSARQLTPRVLQSRDTFRANKRNCRFVS